MNVPPATGSFFLFCVAAPHGSGFMVPVLGRVDNHREAHLEVDFKHLYVASFARCAASRFRKRLDLLKIDLKSAFSG